MIRLGLVMSSALEYSSSSQNYFKGKGLSVSLEYVLGLLMYGQAAGAACVEEIGITPGVTSKGVRKLIEEQG